MSENNQPSFKFAFLAHQDIQAEVVKFTGRARLNNLYHLKALLLVPAKSLEKADWADFFATPCELSVTAGPTQDLTGDQAFQTKWTGLLTRMSAGAQLGDLTYMEVELTPWLGLLAGQTQNRVHLGQSCLGVLRESFQFGGLEPKRFRFRANGANYPKKDFIFQHEEDLLEFVWRTLAHDGLSLYYEPGSEGEVAVIVDHNTQFPSLVFEDHELILTYATTSGLAPGISEPKAYNFQVESSLPPQTLLLRDYNWEDPNRPLEVRLQVCPQGQGEVHLYGENFASKAEGARLAKIRRERILANSELYRLTTTVPGFKPGLTFTLTGHPWAGFNDRYLTVATDFRGTQTGALSSRLGVDLGHEDLSFKHELVCQKVAIPYRPTASQPRKKIAGSLTAWIDGAGSGENPELDKYGRYKVLLPQDISGRDGGKASAWIRMAQPYVGNGYGQHFPLTPGVEVLLTFIDGNPDRPVISGAVANAETNSLINSATSNLSGLGTKGGSSLLFHETAGQQKVALTSGSDRGSILIASSSPTAALFESDQITTFANGACAGVANKEISLVGSENAVVVDNSKLITLTTLVQTLMEVGLGLTDFGLAVKEEKEEEKKKEEEEEKSEGEGEGEEEDDEKEDEDEDETVYGLSKNKSAIVEKSMGLLNFAINEVSSLYYQLEQKKLLSEIPLKPHRNLVELTASPKGAKSVMRTTKDSDLTLVNCFSLLGTLANIVETGIAGRGYENSLEDEDKSGVSKKYASGISYASVAAEILCELLLKAILVKTMISPLGKPTGMLINNEDSYLNVRSRNFAALSAKGPVIVESIASSLTDMLRHDFNEEKASKDLLKPDFTGSPIGVDYIKSKVVLLLSDLIRARADEVSLQAYHGLTVKSAKDIQLIAGVNNVQKVGLTTHETQKKALETVLASGEVGEFGEDVVKDYSMKITGDILENEFPVPYEKAIENGVLIRTEGEGNILFQTQSPNSKIVFAQGDSLNFAENSTDCLMVLDKNCVNIRSDIKNQLYLSKDRASLLLNEESGLSMASKNVILGVSNSVLSFNEGKTKLVSKSSLEVAAQSCKFALSPTEIEIASPPVAIKLSAAGIQFG